jgi:hypothetical protein
MPNFNSTSQVNPLSYAHISCSVDSVCLYLESDIRHVFFTVRKHGRKEVKTTTTTRKEVLYSGRTFLAKGKKEGNEKNRVMCFFLPVMEKEKDGKKKKTRGMFLSWKAFLGCPLLLSPSLS